MNNVLEPRTERCAPGKARPGCDRRMARAPLVVGAVVILVLLAACGSIQPRTAGAGLRVGYEGLATAAGTWHWKDYLGVEGPPGTALLAGFRFVSGSPSSVVAVFDGPSGWNGNQAAEIPLSYDGTSLPYDAWQYDLVPTDPSVSPIDVSLTAGNVIYKASVAPDVTAGLTPPVARVSDLQTKQVTVDWDPVAGAKSYAVFLSATRTMHSATALAKAFGTATQAILTPSVTLQSGQTYWIGVFAFSTDLVLGGTLNSNVNPAPDSFNVSSTEIRVVAP